MTNMRRGFTMIELIFVIVIIGILAAVAVPKLAGTASKARVGVMEGFVGTLNRSVGPAMWATVVDVSGAPGDVTGLVLSSYTDIPTGVVLVGQKGLEACGDPVIGKAAVPTTYVKDQDGVDTAEILVPGTDAVIAKAGYEKIADINTLEQPAAIYCLNGTGTDSPKFGFNEQGSQKIVYTPAP